MSHLPFEILQWCQELMAAERAVKLEELEQLEQLACGKVSDSYLLPVVKSQIAICSSYGNIR